MNYKSQTLVDFITNSTEFELINQFIEPPLRNEVLKISLPFSYSYPHELYVYSYFAIYKNVSIETIRNYETVLINYYCSIVEIPSTEFDIYELFLAFAKIKPKSQNVHLLVDHFVIEKLKGRWYEGYELHVVLLSILSDFQSIPWHGIRDYLLKRLRQAEGATQVVGMRFLLSHGCYSEYNKIFRSMLSELTEVRVIPFYNIVIENIAHRNSYRDALELFLSTPVLTNVQAYNNLRDTITIDLHNKHLEQVNDLHANLLVFHLNSQNILPPPFIFHTVKLLMEFHDTQTNKLYTLSSKAIEPIFNYIKRNSSKYAVAVTNEFSSFVLKEDVLNNGDNMDSFIGIVNRLGFKDLATARRVVVNSREYNHIFNYIKAIQLGFHRDYIVASTSIYRSNTNEN